MADFEIVHKMLWSDEHFAALSTDARLLFIWTLTNPNANLCGLYEASLMSMRRALGVDGTDGIDGCTKAIVERVHAALDELAAKPMVAYDFDNEVVWVVNRLLYVNRSPKQRLGALRAFEQAPRSPLRDRFQQKYGSIIDGWKTSR